jgi:hypothetical protein
MESGSTKPIYEKPVIDCVWEPSQWRTSLSRDTFRLGIFKDEGKSEANEWTALPPR